LCAVLFVSATPEETFFSEVDEQSLRLLELLNTVVGTLWSVLFDEVFIQTQRAQARDRILRERVSYALLLRSL
jgi:uncharacterized membrane protein